jgi:hypothetical protein
VKVVSVLHSQRRCHDNKKAAGLNEREKSLEALACLDVVVLEVEEHEL